MKNDFRDITDIPELGGFLKKSREEQGISLEQVHSITKIRNKYIIAIEEGNFLQIPGGEVYVKGFLRNYSNAVNLDSDEILRLYKSLTGKSSIDIEPERVPIAEDVKDGTKSAGIDIKPNVKAAILVILVAAVCFVFVKSVFRPSIAPPHDGIEISAPEGDDIPPIESEDPYDPSENESEDSKVPVVILAHEDEKNSIYIVDNDISLTVDVEVVEGRCWISSKLDEMPGFEGTLSKGEMQTLNAQNAIVMRAGNPQGIRLTINRQDMGVPGGTARDFLIERSK